MTKQLGVTLLEILLVLAIAAMIIIMSIRYYQSASSSQQANMAMEEIQAITAAADNLALGTGSYTTGATATNLANVVGAANMMSPTNQPIVYAPASASTYTVSMPLTTTVCTSVLAKLTALTKITNAACNSGTLTYTYDNTK